MKLTDNEGAFWDALLSADRDSDPELRRLQRIVVEGLRRSLGKGWDADLRIPEDRESQDALLLDFLRLSKVRSADSAECRDRLTLYLDLRA